MPALAVRSIRRRHTRRIELIIQLIHIRAPLLCGITHLRVPLHQLYPVCPILRQLQALYSKQAHTSSRSRLSWVGPVAFFTAGRLTAGVVALYPVGVIGFSSFGGSPQVMSGRLGAGGGGGGGGRLGPAPVSSAPHVGLEVRVLRKLAETYR